MAQNLEYRIQTKLDDASVNQVQKDLNSLEDKLRKGVKPDADAKVDTKASEERVKSAEKELSVLKELRKERSAKQEQLAQINKAKRDGSAFSEQATNAQRTLGAEIQSLTQQLQEANRGFSDQETILSEIPTTYSQVVEQNRALMIAMKEVPLDDTTGQLQALQAQYNANNTTLKEFDASIGNNQRNVGNYENSIRSAANAIAVFQGPLGPIAGRLNSIATVFSRLTKTQETTTASTKNLSFAMKAKNVITTATIPLIGANATGNVALGASARVANAGIKALNFGLGALRLALAATGIGAIVLAFISLVQYFKRSEDGAERLRVRMAGLNAIVDTFREVLITVGKTLADMWDDPKQGIKDLGDLIATNLMNRVTAIGDAFSSLGSIIKGAFTLDRSMIEEGMVGVANAALQFATGVEDVVDKAKDLVVQMAENKEAAEGLEEEMNAILRIERELGVERAQMNRDFQQAREFARDLNQSYDERLSRLNEARIAQNELAQRELENEQKRLEVMEEQFGLAISGTEEFDKLAEQREKVAKIEEESAQRNISLLRDITAVERQRDEFILRSLRERISASERATELRIAQTQRELERSGQMVELAQLKEDAFKHNLESERNARFLAYQQEYLNQNFSAEESARMANKKADEELEIERLALADETADAIEQRELARIDAVQAYERLERQRAFDDTLHGYQQRNDQIGALEQERLFVIATQNAEHEARLTQLTQERTAQGISLADAEAMARAQIANENASELEDIERKLSDARLDMQAKMMDGIVGLTKNSLNAIFGDNKSAAVASAIIDTYAGATKALASAPPPLGFINAAAVVAAGVANVRKIMSTTKDSKSVSASTPNAPRPSEQFALIDTENMGGNLTASTRAVAENQSGGANNPNVNVILDGEFDPQFLSIKVRQGNNSISSQGVFTKNQG